MGQSNFSGPVKSTGGFIAGSDGSTITKILKGTVAVTVSALAAAAEEDITLTITGAAAGDYVDLVPTNSAAETGLAKLNVWVSAANTVKLRISNVNAAAALAGTTQSWTYLVIKS